MESQFIQGRDPSFEERVEAEWFQETVGAIQGLLEPARGEKTAPPHNLISDKLYRYLVWRASPTQGGRLDLDGQVYASYMETCMRWEQEFKDNEVIDFAGARSWVSFFTTNKEEVPVETLADSCGRSIEVAHKVYLGFQLPPGSSASEYVERCQHFFRELAEALCAYGMSHRDRLAVKITSDPASLFTTRDSVVIHHRRQRSATDIDRIVQDISLKYQLTFTHDWRTPRGFDLEAQGWFNGSYTRILSRIAAAALCEEAEKGQNDLLSNGAAGLHHFLEMINQSTPEKIIFLLERYKRFNDARYIADD